jgi:hypothetical protein
VFATNRGCKSVCPTAACGACAVRVPQRMRHTLKRNRPHVLRRLGTKNAAVSAAPGKDPRYCYRLPPAVTRMHAPYATQLKTRSLTTAAAAASGHCGLFAVTAKHAIMNLMSQSVGLPGRTISAVARSLLLDIRASSRIRTRDLTMATVVSVPEA